MYLVVGASGFLGHYVIKSILNLTNDKIIATYKNNLPNFSNPRLNWVSFDAENSNQITELDKKCDNDTKVIYLTSYSSPDFCEKNPETARKLNIEALADFLDKFNNLSCLYYASTDVVYGNGDNPFKEDAPYNPVNEYGRQKVEAEKLVLSKNYNVIRLPLMMGHGFNKKHFYDKICEDLQAARKLEMFKDSYRSTLSFSQCADFFVKLAEKYRGNTDKIVNFASDEPLSKYDLALKIAEDKGYDKSNIVAISINDTNSYFSAKRAAKTVMDNSRLKKLLNINEIYLEF